MPRIGIPLANISAGRSINLSLSDRGLKALRMAGVEDKAKELCIPMKGRLMHDAKSNTFESNYSLNAYFTLCSYFFL